MTCRYDGYMRKPENCAVLRPQLRFYCDHMRHLVCIPYSVENLHRMAENLGIKRCWFHSSAHYKHYDIPKQRMVEIQAKCEVVTPRRILEIVKGSL